MKVLFLLIIRQSLPRDMCLVRKDQTFRFKLHILWVTLNSKKTTTFTNICCSVVHTNALVWNVLVLVTLTLWGLFSQFHRLLIWLRVPQRPVHCNYGRVETHRYQEKPKETPESLWRKGRHQSFHDITFPLIIEFLRVYCKLLERLGLYLWKEWSGKFKSLNVECSLQVFSRFCSITELT